jgi:hypothetical protein
MRHGLFVDNRSACPRCSVRPTLYLPDRSSLCMNCKLRWQSELAGAEMSQVGEPEPNAPIPIGFDAHEVERLMIYRGAVQAGLFTDYVPADGIIAIRGPAHRRSARDNDLPG